MKKIHIFTQSRKNVYGGTDTSVGAFATRELAEKALRICLERNNRQGMFSYSDIVEATVYEQEEELPDFLS